MADLFRILDGINSSDTPDRTLSDIDEIIGYAEAAGESITVAEAKRISKVGRRWRSEQDNGNGEWSRMRHEAQSALSDPQFEIIFDNGGGATLQVNDQQFVHHYDDMDQLAQDVMSVVAGEDVADWEGHEPECYISDEQFWAAKPNGGYLCIDQDDYSDTDYLQSAWGNVKAFAMSVGRSTGAVRTLYVVESGGDEAWEAVPSGEFHTLAAASDGLRSLKTDLGWKNLRVVEVEDVNGLQRTVGVVAYDE